MNIIRPFGPPIYENKILDNEIIEINKYLDENLLQDDIDLISENLDPDDLDPKEYG